MTIANNRYSQYYHHPGSLEESEYRNGVRNDFLAHRPWSATELRDHFANYPGSVEVNYVLDEEEARLNSPEAPRPF